MNNYSCSFTDTITPVVCGGNRYSNQHNLKYQDALGNALLKYAHVVPGGMLVFFPSYGLLEKMRDRWQVKRRVSIACEAESRQPFASS